jgi:hypothetical protein
MGFGSSANFEMNVTVHAIPSNAIASRVLFIFSRMKVTGALGRSLWMKILLSC